MASALKRLLPTFDLAPDRLDSRLRARLSRGEFMGLALNLLMTIGFLFINPSGSGIGPDLHAVTITASGDMHGYFYSYWFLPLYKALGLLPFPVAFCISNLINLAGIWLACRVFNGKTAVALLSYQTLYVMFYGQQTGLLLGGLALMYWAMEHRRYWLAGLGVAIALIKYQAAAPLILAIWLTDGGFLRDRLRVLGMPTIIMALSLIIYPGWPLELINRIISLPPDVKASIVLWQWIGPLSLVLWLPVIFVPLSRGRRLVATASATALALPYLQQAELLLLFMLPVGGVGLLGNFGFLKVVADWQALRALTMIPILIYIWVFASHIREKLQVATSAPAWQDTDSFA